MNIKCKCKKCGKEHMSVLFNSDNICDKCLRSISKSKTFPEILCEPQLVKPLHGLNPRTIKGQGWWDHQRKLVCESNDNRCLACGVHKDRAKFRRWLEGHESYEIDFSKHQYKLKKIVPLCHYCHNYIHAGRLLIFTQKGKVSKKRYQAIISHGDKILEKYNLNKDAYLMKLCNGDSSKLYPEDNGTWNKWYLLLEGKKYYSRFKNYNEWCEFYEN